MKLLLFCLSLGLLTHNAFGQFSGALKLEGKDKYKGVKSIVSDDYAVWVGTEEGIKRLEVQLDSVVAISERKTSKPVLSLMNEKEVMWVGIESKGVYLFDKKTYQFKGKFKKQLGRADVILIEREKEKIKFYTMSGKCFEMTRDSSLQFISDSVKIDLSPNIATKFKGNVIEIRSNRLFFRDQDQSVKDQDSIVDMVDSLRVANTVEQGLGLSKKEESESILLEEKQAVNLSSPTECQEGCSGLWYLTIGTIVIGYSLLLYFFIAKKFKKDIRVLEDQLLKELKKK